MQQKTNKQLDMIEMEAVDHLSFLASDVEAFCLLSLSLVSITGSVLQQLAAPGEFYKAQVSSHGQSHENY